jgi:NADH:ubiquinone oxidoreductase subunit 3 (subunit A)
MNRGYEEIMKKISVYFEVYPGFMCTEYFKIFTLAIYIGTISIFLFVVAYVLSLNTLKDTEKLGQYECGFKPLDEATRQQFDVHFYMVGILFLIFDVEVSLVFP